MYYSTKVNKLLKISMDTTKGKIETEIVDAQIGFQVRLLLTEKNIQIIKKKLILGTNRLSVNHE